MTAMSAWERLDVEETDETVEVDALDYILTHPRKLSPLELVARDAIDEFAASGRRVGAQLHEARVIATLVTTSGAAGVDAVVAPCKSLYVLPEGLLLLISTEVRDQTKYRCWVIAIDRATLVRTWRRGPDGRNADEEFFGITSQGVVHALGALEYRNLAARFRPRP